MRVLIACEFSGAVREAFRRLGHDAWSCDILPAEDGSPFHYECDVRFAVGVPDGYMGVHVVPILELGWDLMIAHPPCTHLAVSGARWFKDKQAEQAEALEFVRMLMAALIPRIALENPISIISSRIRKPDQIIHPWQFGHGEVKATCLWLKNLPKLEPTNIVEGRYARVHREPPSPDRWKKRSITYQGIADAMAERLGSPAANLGGCMIGQRFNRLTVTAFSRNGGSMGIARSNPGGRMRKPYVTQAAGKHQISQGDR